jgi:hypothetical protein
MRFRVVLPSSSNPYKNSKTSEAVSYNATSSLVRFENENIFVHMGM